MGLSNFRYRTLGTGINVGIFGLEGNLQPCEVVHPTIPDSVMNYDGE